MERKRAEAILHNTLDFSIEAECDWCGRKSLVAICNYGTSYYNRLICYECADEIDFRTKYLFGYEAQWYNKETIDEAKKILNKDRD